MMGPLSGRVAIVTGAGRGIGAEVAVAYAAAGARLTIASRTVRELEAVASRCRELGAECQVCVTDVASAPQVDRLVQATLSSYGQVDVLANVAGVYGPIGPLTDVDIDAWVNALHVNLLGTLYACRAVLPSMIARRSGRIVNLSGGGATSPLPRFSAYGVSKAAVVRLTETLAEEVRAHGITINAIAPGAIDTSLQDAILRAGAAAGGMYERIVALRQTGAGGTPVEVPVKLALFLASDASGSLTGKLIAAPHDAWSRWSDDQLAALNESAWLTLRRVDPFTISSLKAPPP